MVKSKELLPPPASDFAGQKINQRFWSKTSRVTVSVTLLVRHPVTKLREAIRGGGRLKNSQVDVCDSGQQHTFCSLSSARLLRKP